MKNKEVKVGIFVAVCIALLYFGFNFLKGIDFFSSTNKYYAVYDNVDRLAASNPVLVNGFAVGRVSRISILQNKQNKVLVELDIDSRIVLGEPTTATLSSDFLGSKSILLTIGSGKIIKPKDTVIADVAKGTFDVLEETATPVANNIQTTLRKFNTLLDNLNNESLKLDVIIKGLQATPPLLNTTLTTATAGIGDLGSNVKSVTANLNATLDELKPTLQNFRIISDSLKQIRLNQTLVKTQQTIDGLNQTLKLLNRGDNTASKLLTSDSLYNNLNRLLISLDSLSVHFNENPRHFMAPLGKSKRKIERDRRREAAREKKGT
jgi:phospholipid/cholesterol/gamma-HCH transport system substrate-binding protein